MQKQEDLGWGKSVVEQLAKDLQVEFAGIREFSAQNVWRMRQFYEVCSKQTNLSVLLREISWTHHLEILKCKESQEREFYLKTIKKFGWSYRILEKQIKTESYERWLLI